jgi:hypothetical protein
MKVKVLTGLGFAALLALSFTLVSINPSESVVEKPTMPTPQETSTTEPIGGFVIEDRF